MISSKGMVALSIRGGGERDDSEPVMVETRRVSSTIWNPSGFYFILYF